MLQAHQSGDVEARWRRRKKGIAVDKKIRPFASRLMVIQSSACACFALVIGLGNVFCPEKRGPKRGSKGANEGQRPGCREKDAKEIENRPGECAAAVLMLYPEHCVLQ